MTTLASSRNRVKARVVGIGKRGGKLTWVVPGNDKFIKINWYVLWDFLTMIFWIVILFSCGWVSRIIYMWWG